MTNAKECMVFGFRQIFQKFLSNIFFKIIRQPDADACICNLILWGEL